MEKVGTESVLPFSFPPGCLTTCGFKLINIKCQGHYEIYIQDSEKPHFLIIMPVSNHENDLHKLIKYGTENQFTEFMSMSLSIEILTITVNSVQIGNSHFPKGKIVKDRKSVV